MMLQRKMKLRAGSGMLAACLSAVAAANVVTGPAIAQNGQNLDSQAIRAAYKRSDSATNNKDIEGVFREVGADFVAISHTGKRLNRGEYKQQTQALFSMAETITAQNTIETITIKGTSATVLTRNAAAIVVVDAQGQRNTVVASEQTSDTWAKRSGRWLLTQSKALTAQMTVNGKAVKV